jgi:predicted ATPase
LPPSALASALATPSNSENLLSGLLAFLRDKRMLIVLDSCEHLVEAAAMLVEALLKGAPGVQVLATSREPLGVEGEWVERLAPLGIPESQIGLSAADALAFPAIQLLTMQIDVLATLPEGSVPAEALARLESGRVGWNAAEILRVSGEQIRNDGGPEAVRSAEAAFLRSLDVARRQGALSWQLRTAISLARLWRDQNRTREARELLADVHGRFTEGFQTADYAWASTLLRELSASP